jgi:hypothetical protein
MDDDRVALANTLRATAETSAAIGQVRSREVKNSRAYANFLSNLLRYAEETQLPTREHDLPELAVIGDSHCLAFHGLQVALDGALYRTRARLVMGCKAWHLASPETNLYKWRLNGLLDTVAENSPIICCFGEIDCRLDEGILPYYRRAGGDLEHLIADQTSRYVAYIDVAATPRRLKPIFVNVPAPHLDALTAEHPDMIAEDRALLMDIVKMFNMFLRNAVSNRGHRIIDVFAISAGPEGKATGAQHLDAYHLKPDALVLALEQERSHGAADKV